MLLGIRFMKPFTETKRTGVITAVMQNNEAILTACNSKKRSSMIKYTIIEDRLF